MTRTPMFCSPWLLQLFPLERLTRIVSRYADKNSKKSLIWSLTDTNVWVNYAHRIVFGRCRGRRGCNSGFLWGAVIHKYLMLQRSLALHNSYRSVSTENGNFCIFFHYRKLSLFCCSLLERMKSVIALLLFSYFIEIDVFIFYRE